MIVYHQRSWKVEKRPEVRLVEIQYHYIHLVLTYLL